MFNAFISFWRNSLMKEFVQKHLLNTNTGPRTLQVPITRKQQGKYFSVINIAIHSSSQWGSWMLKGCNVLCQVLDRRVCAKHHGSYGMSQIYFLHFFLQEVRQFKAKRLGGKILGNIAWLSVKEPSLGSKCPESQSDSFFYVMLTLQRCSSSFSGHWSHVGIWWKCRFWFSRSVAGSAFLTSPWVMLRLAWSLHIDEQGSKTLVLTFADIASP